MKKNGVIDLISKETGAEYSFDLGRLRATRGFCPGCHHKRTDKRNRSFRWNAEKGYGFCYYCNVVFYDKDRTAYNTCHSGGRPQLRSMREAPEQPQPPMEVVEIEFIF